ncbi:unnamed protein product [Medioppia subpectinata]|uniref:Kazal-like domain-containing protein n=1 Tax=Medioppia subpectinata TaxID=1979941 RepID=A0A7R9Q3S2_9ACAR|nr:unnamed protein product [Medioppia subpectinata]CAG2111584.1 unnamed protein product [Medioppia subpectinata]
MRRMDARDRCGAFADSARHSSATVLCSWDVDFGREGRRRCGASRHDATDQCSECQFGAKCHVTSARTQCVCEERCEEEERALLCDSWCQSLPCLSPLSRNASQVLLSAVCGQNHKSYASECELNADECRERAFIGVRGTGLCPEDHCLPNTCSQPFAQCLPTQQGFRCFCPQCPQSTETAVCASNGRLYESECHVRRDACLLERDLRVVRSGDCGQQCAQKCVFGAKCLSGKCVCDERCQRSVAWICGTDGISYENECLLRRQSCHLSVEIRVKHSGSCDETSDKVERQSLECEKCEDKRFEPICANDGNTYNNECQMGRSACEKRQELTALFYGQCDDEDRWEGSAADNCHQPCLFGAKCANTAGSAPRCECHFRCSDVTSGRVCGLLANNETRLYDNECRLREESCRRQQSIANCSQLCGHSSPVWRSGRPLACVGGDECPPNSGCVGGVCCQCRCHRDGTEAPMRCDDNRCKCKRGISGVFCDRCLRGFYAFSSSGCSGKKCRNIRAFNPCFAQSANATRRDQRAATVISEQVSAREEHVMLTLLSLQGAVCAERGSRARSARRQSKRQSKQQIKSLFLEIQSTTAAGERQRVRAAGVGIRLTFDRGLDSSELDENPDGKLVLGFGHLEDDDAHHVSVFAALLFGLLFQQIISKLLSQSS